MVNNGAAAVLLALAALAAGRGVAVSRCELVEIGGGFRVPEVMAQSGARLVEVGTTNRTRRSDFERAVAAEGEGLALLLKVHQSNYRIVGFTESVEVAALAGPGAPGRGRHRLGAARRRLPVAGRRPAGVAGRRARRPPDPAAGADLVTFSGDKLVGGPQAGHHRRPGATWSPAAPPTRWPGPCARRPRARRPPGRWPSPTSTGGAPTSPSGGWPTSPVAELRARADAGLGGRARSSGDGLGARWRDAARGRDPLGRRGPRRRPHGGGCGPRRRPVIARVEDGRTLARPAHASTPPTTPSWPRR